MVAVKVDGAPATYTWIRGGITLKMKTCILFSVLSILPFCIYNGLLRGLGDLTAYSRISNNSSGNVTILMWHWPFGVTHSLSGNTCWDLYRIPRCRLVDNHTLFPSADVVVFHNRELIDGSQKLPLELPRPEWQRWAWLSLEAPAHNGNLHKFANIFNMTVSYRRDSDVTITYGERLPKETRGHVVTNDIQNKSTLACWVVSNYQNHHKRSQVYKELNAIIPVKVYGKLTNTILSSNDLLPTISRCYFYLAFENSVSKDYITEKLWKNAYQGGAVPVVLGPPPSDYKAVAPPNSFIHVDDFWSVKDLAEFLQELAKDEKRYGQYFTWKQEWEVKVNTDWRERLCKICLKYHSLPQKKVYYDLASWVNSDFGIFG